MLSAGVGTADDNRDALWAAVRGGDAKAVAELLDKGAKVNAANEINVTALWIAASKGNLEVIELLVKRGADVNARDGIWYQTPLSYAVGSEKPDIVKFLIQSGARDIDNALILAAATPAISGGTLYLRSQHFLFALGRKPTEN
jgi:ankyrin repeat protein